MIQKIKNTLVAVAALLALSAPALLPVSAYAASTVNINDSLCGGSNIKLSQDSSCKSGGANTNSLQTLLSNIVNIFSIIVGVIAVIMIIVGGLRYITSGGDSGNVSTAKNTIIYAIVGLVIVALAQLIVHFVLNQTSNLTT
jgi:cytochrome bd-type quinol oxidase subunit 2